MTAPDEVVLDGGTANRGLVVRVGDTVRRPAGEGSAAVHALLRYLERAGFGGAPRLLGRDDQGREMLSFVEGEVPTAPPPSWALRDDALADVADLLRGYHRAARGFDPAPHTWAVRVPQPYTGTLVTHNDPNLDNVVFRAGRPVALIDFDLAAPADRIWDVALAARLWVPLRDPVDIPDERSVRQSARLRLFADTYGLGAEERLALPGAVRASHRWCYDIIRAGAAAGRDGYAHYWTAGAQAHDARGQAWLDTHLVDLAAALSPQARAE